MDQPPITTMKLPQSIAFISFPNHMMSLCIWAGILAASMARAEDWPQFGGANRNAVWNETGIMQTFPADGLKIHWRAPVGGGMSSPVITNGRVYLSDSTVEKPKAWERIHCFDEKSGACSDLHPLSQTNTCLRGATRESSVCHWRRMPRS